MNNSTSKSSIIKDIAVFDYVADNQADAVRTNFENALENDSDLKQNVAIERQLRKHLQLEANVDEVRPVSMQNFDALLYRINRDENEGVSELNKTFEASSNNASKHNAVAAKHWQRPFSIAASIVFVAMIGVIGFNQTTKPEFKTLSNGTASSEINFVGLVEQQRLVKLTLSESLSNLEIIDLLETYQLSSVQSGSIERIVLVSSQQPADKEQMVKWAEDRRITSVELISIKPK